MARNSGAAVGTPMRKVMLIHAGSIPHYRCAVYSYLSTYLAQRGYALCLLAEGIENGGPQELRFRLEQRKLTVRSILDRASAIRPESVILFTGLRSLWLFPVLAALKVSGIKVVYWGHGINLQKKDSLRSVYSLYHELCDAIILYGEHLRRYIRARLQSKVFVANNTLNTNELPAISRPKREILNEHGIGTTKNIICVGRLQRRKRVEHLLDAFLKLNSNEFGLILVGPDPEGLLTSMDHPRIFKMGPLYGKPAYELLYASDVCCIPGAVGLSIVDGFYYGLPLVTEDVDHGPEIMYLKNGLNGYIVPAGDIEALAEGVRELLDDEGKRRLFSVHAKETIMREGHIDRLCQGFEKALNYVHDA